jgi:biotin synthase
MVRFQLLRRTTMNTDDLLAKAREEQLLSKQELVYLLSLPPDSREVFCVMAEACRISKQLSGGQAEVHAQFAVNLAPCSGNCLFCSFAMKNGIFDKEVRISADQAVAYAKQFEADGANAVFMMTTATYPFGLFIEISTEVRKALRKETKLVANVGDQSLSNAQKLKDTGFCGVYHALRLREGIDSNLKPEHRRESVHNFMESGLGVGTCVEPVGPEHTNEEIADLILFTRSFDAAFSGAARRIAIPGTRMAKLGMISELRMAQIVAVTRLGVHRTVVGNCTHEPCTLGAIAGANLFWAEVGANPRDIKEKTEDGRGESVPGCRRLFDESGWYTLKGPSKFYK